MPCIIYQMYNLIYDFLYSINNKMYFAPQKNNTLPISYFIWQSHKYTNHFSMIQKTIRFTIFKNNRMECFVKPIILIPALKFGTFQFHNDRITTLSEPDSSSINIVGV